MRTYDQWVRRCHVCNQVHPERQMWKVWDQGEVWLCERCLANWDQPEKGQS